MGDENGQLFELNPDAFEENEENDDEQWAYEYNESASINNENIDDDKSKKGMDSPEFLAYFEQFILDMIYLMIKTRMMKMMTMTMMKKIWNMQLAQRDHIEFNHH